MGAEPRSADSSPWQIVPREEELPFDDCPRAIGFAPGTEPDFERHVPSRSNGIQASNRVWAWDVAPVDDSRSSRRSPWPPVESKARSSPNHAKSAVHVVRETTAEQRERHGAVARVIKTLSIGSNPDYFSHTNGDVAAARAGSVTDVGPASL
jgi:hypothetical protein